MTEYDWKSDRLGSFHSGDSNIAVEIIEPCIHTHSISCPAYTYPADTLYTTTAILKNKILFISISILSLSLFYLSF